MVWFVNALDKEQSSVLKIPVRFAGIPQDVRIITPLPEFLSLEIRDDGKNIIKYNKAQLPPLTIDLTKRNFYEDGEFLFTADQLRGQIAHYLQASTIVEQIFPDSILLKYEKLASKEVPVVANLSLDLAQQYMLSEDLRIEPNTITVFAPKRMLDTLKNVYTEQITLANVKDTMLVTAKLQTLENVRFSATDVRLRINVEMFTEKQMQISVTIINCPQNVKIKTFPGIVDATCNVGFSFFNSVTANDIQAVFDYNDIKTNDYAKVKLKAQSLVPHVSNIQLLPDEVEFIIENNKN
jgi:hypothetical protein